MLPPPIVLYKICIYTYRPIRAVQITDIFQREMTNECASQLSVPLTKCSRKFTKRYQIFHLSFPTTGCLAPSVWVCAGQVHYSECVGKNYFFYVIQEVETEDGHIWLWSPLQGHTKAWLSPSRAHLLEDLPPHQFHTMMTKTWHFEGTFTVQTTVMHADLLV